jgi:hypothetical protein
LKQQIAQSVPEKNMARQLEALKVQLTTKNEQLQSIEQQSNQQQLLLQNQVKMLKTQLQYVQTVNKKNASAIQNLKEKNQKYKNLIVQT